MNPQTNRPDDYRFPRPAFEDASGNFASELELITNEARAVATEIHLVDEKDVDPTRGEFGESVIRMAASEHSHRPAVVAHEAPASIELPTDYKSLIHPGRLVVQMRHYELPDEAAA